MAIDTRERILETAQDLFARLGYEKTGLAQIAGQVGITKPAIYYYFHSKEELLAALLERFSADVRRVLEPILATGTPEEQLASLIHCYVGVLRERYDLAQVISREFFGEGTEVLGPLATRVQEQLILPIDRVVRRGVDTSAFRAVDPRLAALSILGTIHAYLAEYRLTGATTAVDAFADHTVAFVLEGLSPR